MIHRDLLINVEYSLHCFVLLTIDVACKQNLLIYHLDIIQLFHACL